jgi:hypothetical protein
VRSGRPDGRAERTPGVGTGMLAETEADATSTGRERRASGGRGGGNLQAWGEAGQRRQPLGGGFAGDRGVRRTSDGAAGRCRKASPAVGDGGGGDASADCSGGGGQTLSPGEERDTVSLFFFSIPHSVHLRVAICSNSKQRRGHASIGSIFRGEAREAEQNPPCTSFWQYTRIRLNGGIKLMES